MSDTTELCHIAIRAGTREADLALPIHVPISELIPAALELFADDGLPRELAGRTIQLTRPGAAAFDGGKSLSECEVRDGEFLVLQPVPQTPSRPDFDTCGQVRETICAAQLPWPPGATVINAWLIPCWPAAVIWAALGWGLIEPQAPKYPGVCATGAALAIFGALLARRWRSSSPVITALGVVAVGFLTLTAALALSEDPLAAQVLLAASVCAASSALVAQLLHCSTRLLVPIATVSTVTAAAAVGVMQGWWPPAAFGPILITCGFGILIAAPRLAARSAQLIVTDLSEVDIPRRARIAHRCHTVLILTSVSLTVLGTILTAVNAMIPFASHALIGVVIAQFGLRACSHTDFRHIGIFAVGAGIAGTTLVALMVALEPGSTPWVCFGLAVGVPACTTLVVAGRRQSSLTTNRVTGVCEFISTTAVLPLSCWVAGLFSTVRGLAVQ